MKQKNLVIIIKKKDSFSSFLGRCANKWRTVSLPFSHIWLTMWATADGCGPALTQLPNKVGSRPVARAPFKLSHRSYGLHTHREEDVCSVVIATKMGVSVVITNREGAGWFPYETIRCTSPLLRNTQYTIGFSNVSARILHTHIQEDDFAHFSSLVSLSLSPPASYWLIWQAYHETKRQPVVWETGKRAIREAKGVFRVLAKYSSLSLPFIYIYISNMM